MPVYAGRRAGTWRVTAWSKETGQLEQIVEGLKRDARRVERELQGQVAEKKAQRRASPTFRSFSLETYQPYAKAQFGANTWHRTRKYTVARLIRFFGSTRLDSISTEQVEKFKRSRQGDGRLASTINMELVVLKAMLAWGRDDMKLAVAQPSIRLLPTHGRRRPKAWTLEQIGSLYAALPAHLLPIVQFMLNTGLRKEEAVACTWEWIDLEGAMLRIPVDSQWSPKNGEPREVPIDALVAMLRALPRTHEQVFLSTRGGPFAAFPDKTFTEARRAAGVPGSPHWTRHTFASHFLRKTRDLGLLAKVLGHSRTQVTEVYAHFLPDHLEAARFAVDLTPNRLASGLATAQ